MTENKIAQKKWMYWTFQLSGWGFILFLGLLSEYQSHGNVAFRSVIESMLIFVFGVAITHLYRYLIIKYQWLDVNLAKAIPKILIGSLALGAAFFLLDIAITYVEQISNIGDENTNLSSLFGGKNKNFSFGFLTLRIGLILINRSLLFFIWSLIYFAYHYFERLRDQEIRQLQWEASKNESELQNLKNQLNPHFMFNAMNSIRALIDEDPLLAKKSVTQLSNLLRNTLKTGKDELITLEQEMKIVHDYLALEKIRFEERLLWRDDIDVDLKMIKIPPLLLQTLVENAVKHGISNLEAGGEISVLGFKEGSNLILEVINDGEYKPGFSSSGIGLENSKKRLNILYGNKAKLSIEEKEGKVITRVVIPVEKK